MGNKIKEQIKEIRKPEQAINATEILELLAQRKQTREQNISY